MKANKFVAKLGNDTIIKVYFYDTDGGRVVVGMGDQPQSVAPFDISGAKDVRVDLVDVMRGKRTKMSPVIDKHIMSIELNEDVQRLGEYFLDIRFGMPNGAFSDGVQAYRLKLSGIAIVESGETSGDIGATFDGLMVGGMSRAELLAEVEQLKQDKTLIETELSEMTEAKAQAESERNEANRAKTTAETERDEANKAKATAETERDEANRAKATAESERDEALEGKAQAESERDQALESKATAETERDEANKAKATAETERDEANKAKTTAESERDQALEGKATAETERDEANKAKKTAETERDQALQDKATAEAERDEANRAKATAETERDEANKAKVTAETERDEANKAKVTAETERDEANRAKATAETERDQAKEAQSELETRLRRNIQGVRNYRNKIGNISNEIITEVRDREFEGKGVYGFRLDNVTVVGSRAFFACEIESVDLPEATHIKHGAFQECNSLRVVKIPKVTTVDEGAFVNISSYSEIIVSEEIFDKLSSQTDSDNLKYFSPHPWREMGRLSVTVIATVSQRRLSIYREV